MVAKCNEAKGGKQFLLFLHLLHQEKDRCMFGFLMLLECISYGNYCLLGKCYFFFLINRRFTISSHLLGMRFHIVQMLYLSMIPWSKMKRSLTLSVELKLFLALIEKVSNYLLYECYILWWLILCTTSYRLISYHILKTLIVLCILYSFW